jgi:hypothetical protein
VTVLNPRRYSLTLSADSWVDDDDAIDEKEEEEEADSARDTNGLGPTKAQDACDYRILQ